MYFLAKQSTRCGLQPGMAKRKRQEAQRDTDTQIDSIQPRQPSSEVQATKGRPARSKSAFDSQIDCPFFHPARGLPREIRNIIYEMALTSYEDACERRFRDAIGPRPYGDRFDNVPPCKFCFRRTSTALLRTCRAIYQETRLLPVALNVQILWYKKYIGSQSTLRPSPTTAKDYFKGMSTEQLEAIVHLQIVLECRRTWYWKDGISLSILAQLGLVRGVNPEMQRLCRAAPARFNYMCPETLTITLRDMHFYDPLFRLEDIFPDLRWKHASGWLKTLRLEFQIPMVSFHTRKFRRFVSNLSEKAIDIGNGEELVADRNVRETTCICAFMEDPRYTHGRWRPIQILVATVTWRVRSASERVLV